MVRISDILKKKLQGAQPPKEEKILQKEEIPKEEPAKEEAKKPAPQEEAPVEVSKAMAQREEPEEPKPEMQIAKAMKEMIPDLGRADEIYKKGAQLANQLLDSIAAGKKHVDFKPIKGIVEEIVDTFILGDKSFLIVFYKDYPPQDYLVNHMWNVTILAIATGLELKYNKSRLNELGLAALLHDLGMVRLQEIALKAGILTKVEFERIKEHPLYGVEILEQIKNSDISEAVIRAVGEQHEKNDGSGYPKGIKNGEISEYARIIATVDVYEALCHSRVYRQKFPSYEAVKELIAAEKSSAFDPHILKVLVEYIGIYPIGSYVELNTSEIGIVTGINENFPLRPVVNVIFDSGKRRLPEPRVVNLTKHLNIFIKKPLSDKEAMQATKK